MRLFYKFDKPKQATTEFVHGESKPDEFWFEGNHFDYALIADAIIWLLGPLRVPLEHSELTFIRAITAKLITRHRLDLEEVNTLERFYTKRGSHRFTWKPTANGKFNYFELTRRDFDPLQMFIRRFAQAGINLEEFAGCEVVYCRVKKVTKARASAKVEAQLADMQAQIDRLTQLIEKQASATPPIEHVRVPANDPDPTAEYLAKFRTAMKRHYPEVRQ